MEVWAKVSEAKHLVPDQPADVEKLRDFAPGSLVKIDVKRPRRRKPHSMFFAVIARAFENWPELHEFQPENPEHLRAWLLVKSGYKSIFGESMNRLNNNPMRIVRICQISHVTATISRRIFFRYRTSRINCSNRSKFSSMERA